MRAFPPPESFDGCSSEPATYAADKVANPQLAAMADEYPDGAHSVELKVGTGGKFAVLFARDYASYDKSMPLVDMVTVPKVGGGGGRW